MMFSSLNVKPAMQPIGVCRPPSNTIPFDPRTHRRLNQISNFSSKNIKLPTSRIKLWSSEIEQRLRNGSYDHCISSYHQMLDENIAPTPTVLAHVLDACCSLSDLRTLRTLQNDMIRYKLDSHASLATALLKAYFKCGSPETAHQLFDKMLQRDIVSWTVIISGEYKSGQLEKSVHYFRLMLDEGVAPDSVALVSILSVSARRGCLDHGIEVHGYLIRMDFHRSYALTSSLVNLYARLGRMDYADRIFCCTVEKNVVAWTAMMAGLARAHDPISALLMYGKMVDSGIEPNEKSVSCALRAVCQLGFLRLGMQFHGYVIKRKFVWDEYISSSLIELYAKSGASTDICRIFFDKIVHKNAVLCTSMISVYGRRGEGLAALQLFNEMRAAGMDVDSVAFTAILSACCSSGLLREGLQCFELMIQDYKVKPREEHYACLKGLFAKDRRLDEACEAIEVTRLKDDGRIWEAFLGACRVHGSMEYGEIASRKLLEIESGNSPN